MTNTAARLMPYRRLVERADQNRWLRWGVYALVVLSPVLMLLLTSVVLRVDIRDIVPFNSDATFYWHQAKTFAAVGFDGGYYTYEEAIPRVDGVHFYAWGPFTPMFYGLIGRVLGWYPESSVVINTVLLMGSIGFFLYCARPSWWQALLIPLLFGNTMTFWLYFSGSMVVMLHYSIGITLAGCFYILLKEDSKRSKKFWWVVTAAIISVASLLIPIWAPVIIVYFLIAFRGRAWYWTLVAFGFGAAFFGAATLLYILTAAPYPDTLPPFVSLLSQDLGAAMESWLSLILTNLSDFLSDPWLNSAMMRLSAVIILIPAAWYLIQGMLSNSVPTPEPEQARRRSFEWTLHMANLLPILVIYVLIYSVGLVMDRQLAPRMILSSLFLLMYSRMRVLTLVIICGFIGIVPTYQFVTTNIRANMDAGISSYYDEWDPKVSQVLAHVADAPSPWCNSIAVADPYFWSPRLGVLMAIPAGIGISIQGPLPERARYGLLDDDTYRQFGGQGNLALIMEVPEGGIYLNLNSDCPLPPDDVLERAQNVE